MQTALGNPEQEKHKTQMSLIVDLAHNEGHQLGFQSIIFIITIVIIVVAVAVSVALITTTAINAE